MNDRRIHARTDDGRQIVRYDRAGKWYWENSDHRKPIDFKEAVRLATLPGSVVFIGEPGGGRFDAAILKVMFP